MKGPLVSIVMPVYNREKLVGQAIDSILRQTYYKWELIIVNDGSIDGTEEIIKGFLGDKRITYHSHQHNLGLASAYNTGFSLAQGKYIAIQDSDDISLPERLQKEVEVLEKHPKCLVAFSPAQFIDIDGQPRYVWGGNGSKEGVILPEKAFYQLYLHDSFIPNPSVMIRQLEQMRPWYDPDLRICNDYEYLLRMLHDYPFYFITTPLVKMRRGSRHEHVTSLRERNFAQEREIIKRIYRMYRAQQRSPITATIYRKAMSYQLIKETIYYTNNHSQLKGKLSAMQAVFYNPFEKRTWVCLIHRVFGVRVVKFFAKIKKLSKVKK